MMHASPALAALAALAVIACGSFRREPGTRGGAAGADSATMVGDAGSADGDASKCSLMVTDIFGGTHDAGWIDMGQTKVANGQAVLVPDLASKAGAIWPRLPSSITTFHARFTAAIAGAADQKGDGLALAWSTNDGNRYGVCQGGNEGLVLETFKNKVEFATFLESCTFGVGDGTVDRSSSPVPSGSRAGLQGSRCNLPSCSSTPSKH